MANGTASVAVDRDSEDEDDDDWVHPGGVLNPITEHGTAAASENATQSFMISVLSNVSETPRYLWWLKEGRIRSRKSEGRVRECSP